MSNFPCSVSECDCTAYAVSEDASKLPLDQFLNGTTLEARDCITCRHHDVCHSGVRRALSMGSVALASLGPRPGISSPTSVITPCSSGTFGSFQYRCTFKGEMRCTCSSYVVGAEVTALTLDEFFGHASPAIQQCLNCHHGLMWHPKVAKDLREGRAKLSSFVDETHSAAAVASLVTLQKVRDMNERSASLAASGSFSPEFMLVSSPRSPSLASATLSPRRLSLSASTRSPRAPTPPARAAGGYSSTGISRAVPPQPAYPYPAVLDSSSIASSSAGALNGGIDGLSQTGSGSSRQSDSVFGSFVSPRGSFSATSGSVAQRLTSSPRNSRTHHPAPQLLHLALGLGTTDAGKFPVSPQRNTQTSHKQMNSILPSSQKHHHRPSIPTIIPNRSSIGSSVEGSTSSRSSSISTELAQNQPTPPQVSPPAACHHRREPPADLLCPITHDIMTDPVILFDGHTYENSAITAWLEKHDVSPMTGDVLPTKATIPNLVVKKLISAWHQGLIETSTISTP